MSKIDFFTLSFLAGGPRAALAALLILHAVGLFDGSGGGGGGGGPPVADCQLLNNLESLLQTV